MKITFFAAAIFSLAFTAISCSKDDDRLESVIPESELASEARKFVDTYFSGNQILRVEKDTRSTDEYYEIHFAGGTAVDFNLSGQWTEVDGNKQAIPTGFILPAIVDYIKANYQASAIESIDRQPYGFDVDLVNHTELRFNTTGAFLGLDN